MGASERTLDRHEKRRFMDIEQRTGEELRNFSPWLNLVEYQQNSSKGLEQTFNDLLDDPGMRCTEREMNNHLSKTQNMGITISKQTSHSSSLPFLRLLLFQRLTAATAARRLHSITLLLPLTTILLLFVLFPQFLFKSDT